MKSLFCFFPQYCIFPQYFGKLIIFVFLGIILKNEITFHYYLKKFQDDNYSKTCDVHSYNQESKAVQRKENYAMRFECFNGLLNSLLVINCLFTKEESD